MKRGKVAFSQPMRKGQGTAKGNSIHKVMIEMAYIARLCGDLVFRLFPYFMCIYFLSVEMCLGAMPLMQVYVCCKIFIVIGHADALSNVCYTLIKPAVSMVVICWGVNVIKGLTDYPSPIQATVHMLSGFLYYYDIPNVRRHLCQCLF